MAFEVTTHSGKIRTTVAFDTAAYASGDNMGGKIELKNMVRKPGGTCILTDVTIICKNNLKPTFNIVFFGQDPTGATLTDNSPMLLGTSAADAQSVVPVYAIDYVAASSGGVGITNIQLGNVILKELSGKSTSLYMGIVATAANDFVAADDLMIKVGFIQD